MQVKKRIINQDLKNKLVNSGLSFRDAYIKISESIKKGNYIPEKNIEHNLIGSIL